DHVQNADDAPFLTLGRMDGGENRIVLVKGFGTGTATCRVGRVEGQLSEETLSRIVSSCDLLQLRNVSRPQMTIFVYSVQVRLVPLPRELKFCWPRRFGFLHSTDQLGKSGPVFGRRLRNFDLNEKVGAFRPLFHFVLNLFRGAPSNSRQQF